MKRIIINVGSNLPLKCTTTTSTYNYSPPPLRCRHGGCGGGGGRTFWSNLVLYYLVLSSLQFLVVPVWSFVPTTTTTSTTTILQRSSKKKNRFQSPSSSSNMDHYQQNWINIIFQQNSQHQSQCISRTIHVVQMTTSKVMEMDNNDQVKKIPDDNNNNNDDDALLQRNNKKIDGKVIAAIIRQEIKDRVTDMKNTINDGKSSKSSLSSSVIPGLAVILVGKRRDSQTYVNMKKRACEQVGIQSFGYNYNETVTQEELLQQIELLNSNPKVHGILIQLPLPSHINEQTVLTAVSPDKDVDGLHPINVARLALQSTHDQQGQEEYWWEKGQMDQIPFSVPCTPLGCIELLDRSGIEIRGRHAVVIGRSNLVGMPMSFLLLHRHATVTIVHSKTTNIEEIVQKGDIVIAAVGKAELVQEHWIKPGAAIIDVGMNSVDLPPSEVKEGSKKSYKLVGDVDFESVLPKCSQITPVPGGVGPMTIAMLLRNTVNACERLTRKA